MLQAKNCLAEKKRRRVRKLSKLPDRCNDVKELNVLVNTMLELAIADIKEHGVNPLIVETYRAQERQNYLYCQGRTMAECTTKGINSTFAKAYCNPSASKVTWTLNSVHKSRKAIDVIPQRKIDGKMTAIWNSNDTQTKIIIKTMQKYGFESGANWSSSPDSPHFQVKGEFTNVFKQGCNTVYVTKVIQTALNRKLGLNLVIDGQWGDKTTDAVNTWRKTMKWTASSALGATALKELLS